MTQKPTCAGEKCDCLVDGSDAVRVDGKAYCSERCSEGRGCDHADCNCGDFPTAEPKSDVAQRT